MNYPDKKKFAEKYRKRAAVYFESANNLYNAADNLYKVAKDLNDLYLMADEGNNIPVYYLFFTSIELYLKAFYLFKKRKTFREKFNKKYKEYIKKSQNNLLKSKDLENINCHKINQISKELGILNNKNNCFKLDTSKNHISLIYGSGYGTDGGGSQNEIKLPNVTKKEIENIKKICEELKGKLVEKVSKKKKWRKAFDISE